MPAMFWEMTTESSGEAAHICEQLLLVGGPQVMALQQQDCSTITLRATGLVENLSCADPITLHCTEEKITENWVGFRQFPRVVK